MQLRTWFRTITVPVLAAAFAAGAAGCGTGSPGGSGGPGGSGSDHGKVVAYLPIPYAVSRVADTGSAKTVHVRVRPGQRFSVKVATSDGPFAWRQVGRAPDPRVVRVIGDHNEGHCAKALVGCRVPYFHILQAKAAGTTSMAWLYRALNCSSVRKKMIQPTRSCVATVIFDIAVR